MACLTNPIMQPNLDISPIYVPDPLSVMRSPNQRNHCDIKDSQLVHTLKSCGLSFHSTDGASGKLITGFITLQTFYTWILGTWLVS
jgi:hypothetical protein